MEFTERFNDIDGDYKASQITYDLPLHTHKCISCGENTVQCVGEACAYPCHDGCNEV